MDGLFTTLSGLKPEGREARVAELKSPDEEVRRLAMLDLKEGLSEDDLSWLPVPLSDESWRVRKEAIEGISSLAPDRGLISRLIPMMDPTREVTLRNSVVEVLGRMGREAAPLLSERLSVEQPDIRKFLVDILGNIATPSSVPYLVRLLHDPEQNIRAAAAESLANIGDPSSVSALISALDSADDWVAFSILSALSSLGAKEALPSFFRFLDNRILAAPAVRGIGRIGSISDGLGLIDRIPSLPRGAVKTAFAALGAIYRRSMAQETGGDLEKFAEAVANNADERITSFMIDHLEITDRIEERKDCLAALSLIGGDRATEAVLAFIADDSLEGDVGMALFTIGNRDRTILLSLLQNPEGNIRRKALQVLTKLGGTDLLSHIIPMLGDVNGHVRKDAVLAMAALGDFDAIDSILSLLFDEYPDVVEVGGAALSVLGKKDPGAFFGKIGPHLGTSPLEVRALLIRVLGDVDPSTHIDLFLGALRDSEPLIRTSAVRALSRCEGSEAAEAVMGALSDEDPQVRSESAMALEIMRPEGAVEPLKSALYDQDPWVRAASATSLSMQPDLDPGDLSDILHGEDLMLKTAVIEALGRRVSAGYEVPMKLLKEAFIEGTVEIRRAVCRTLGNIPSDAGLDLLMQALGDKDASTRIFAVHSLVGKGGDQVERTLLEMADSDPDRTVRLTIRSLMDPSG